MACSGLNDLPVDYYLLLGNVADTKKLYKEASRAYENCIALGRETGEIYLRYGWCLFKSGDTRRAKTAFQKAMTYPETKEKAERDFKNIF
ncbi:MAG: tetratricopeptide repeat protein [Marinilabiliales bacterium]|nr:tetratricopeptide repeat protein [Marinilabiliales bacterium]